MLTGSLTPVSNRADWIESYELTDSDTGELFDISTATEITVEIREPDCDRALKSATLTGETIEHVSTGIFQWWFTNSEMRSLSSGTYEVFVRIEMDDIVTQLFIGTLPVLDG